MHYSEQETKILKDLAHVFLADAHIFANLEKSGVNRNMLLAFQEKLDKDLHSDSVFQEDHSESLMSDVLAKIEGRELVESDLIDAIDSQLKRISITWAAIDVIDRADERDVYITEDQAYKILQTIGNRYDPNIGVTWELIDHYIDKIEPANNEK